MNGSKKGMSVSPMQIVATVALFIENDPQSGFNTSQAKQTFAELATRAQLARTVSKREKGFPTMAKTVTFKTIFPAVSVPLNEDYSINEPEFRTYLHWIKSFYGKGIEGLVCNGHTGEITSLTQAERKRVVEICAEECGDCMTIISGVNCEHTADGRRGQGRRR